MAEITNRPTHSTEALLSALQERAKELNCLYRVQEALKDPERPLEVAIEEILVAMPTAWQYPDRCMVRITFDSQEWSTPDFVESPIAMCVPITVQDVVEGRICVYYRETGGRRERTPFLPEEQKLVAAIADQIAHFVLHQKMHAMFSLPAPDGESGRSEWQVILNLLHVTDPGLADRISRKMMNYLAFSGVAEAGALVQRHGEDPTNGTSGEVNQPSQKNAKDFLFRLSKETFDLATVYLSSNEILACLHRWIAEDRSAELVNPLVNTRSSMTEVVDALQRFREQLPLGIVLSESSSNGARVALIRRCFTEQLDLIKITKKYLEIEDFCEVADRIIFPAGSEGKVGGKGAGLFLARQVLLKASTRVEALGEIQVPRTWYMASDAIVEFLRYNNLEEVYEQKYKSIEEVRREYPHIVQLFKSSHFPQDLQSALVRALADLGEVPLVIRSSSLLEDRLGAAFSGKYKSLFVANRGNLEQRLAALEDAIAEVYASTFGPDPIEYRAERGLLDFNEEMGILIQEVVGCKVGRYYFPSYAGVAFSNNEFRWSPRIRREDGLIRMVPGLGTRAVDRLTDDYPILVAPGQPGLRVNVSSDEFIRYSPKRIDVIDLDENCFETLDVTDLIQKVGTSYPGLGLVFSLYQDGMLRRIGPMSAIREGLPVVNFDALISSTPFVRKVGAILKTLQDALGTPVDIEFASDGSNFYLLQCRPQSHAGTLEAAEIPPNVPENDILFSANRYVSNGRVPDITHVVYVDPESYAAQTNLQDLVAIGRAIGRLNNLLPKRQFILIGPGRWGSRGDIQLGVRVTYSDINSTAMLVEVARKKGNYVPDLSFGTHFFQDLVEAAIRYLPLYPDDEGVFFNQNFLSTAPNILSTLLPEFSHLADTIRVIDVPASRPGKIIRVLLNAEKDQALALFTDPSVATTSVAEPREPGSGRPEEHWRWRLSMAEKIASSIDARRFGVEALYVFGSTKNANSGPGSDIDLLVHLRATAAQKQDLETWFDGWSLALAEMNYLRTGYKSPGLLDVHYVTDEDIARRTSWAVKIGAITDPARRLALGRKG
jgi:pyruvate, water dikinase